MKKHRLKSKTKPTNWLKSQNKKRLQKPLQRLLQKQKRLHQQKKLQNNFYCFIISVQTDLFVQIF